MKRASKLREVGEPAIEVVELSTDQLSDVRAGQTAGALDRDDLLDLRECEAEPPRLGYEVQQSECVPGVEPVACRRAAWRRDDASPLVESQRLRSRSAPRCDLADVEAVPCHVRER